MKPRIVNIEKAQGFRDEQTQSATIRIEKPFKTPWTGPNCLMMAQLAHARSASKLHRCLLDSLPGGTYDALFGMMCEYKASVFVVHKQKRNHDNSRIENK